MAVGADAHGSGVDLDHVARLGVALHGAESGAVADKAGRADVARQTAERLDRAHFLQVDLLSMASSSTSRTERFD